jgi:hypothetical protein
MIKKSIEILRIPVYNKNAKAHALHAAREGVGGQPFSGVCHRSFF